MAQNTYQALDTKTVGTAVSSVTFTSIPQGYTDLVLVADAINATSVSVLGIRFNGDTTSNYSWTRMYGDGTNAASDRAATQTSGNIGATATTRNVNIAQIMNYSNATTYKTVIARGNNAGGATSAVVSLWRATPAAITSLTVVDVNGYNFAVGSTFTLYGIAAASVGAKATGGTIYQDSSYFYHVFSGNGTFTPSQSLTADILVVAGGGGVTAGSGGGGGGAGGLLAFASQSLTATGYTCTVGAGGANITGGDSQFGALTLVKGGGAGGGATGGTGGSGAGGGGGAGGSATSGQGYAGGYGYSTSTGGGGGAGGIGANGTSGGSYSGAGAGGIGATSSLINAIGVATGTGQTVSGTTYFAGGGGGWGGSPAGGYGGGAMQGSNGIAYMGGGGGGYGSQGGSGIIVVRYAK